MVAFRRLFKRKERPEKLQLELGDLEAWLERRRRALDEVGRSEGQKALKEITSVSEKVGELADELLLREFPADIMKPLRKRVEDARRHFSKGVQALTSSILEKKIENLEDAISLHSDLLNALDRVKRLSGIHGRYASTVFPGVVKSIMDELRRLSSLAVRLEAAITPRKKELELLREISEKKGRVDESQSLLRKLEEEKNSAEEGIEKARENVRNLETQLNEIRNSSEFMKMGDRRKEVHETASKLGEVEAEMRRRLGSLSRPLKKFEKQVDDGTHPVDKKVRKAVKAYVANPVGALVLEEEGYPRLRGVVEEVQTLVEAGKIRVKSRRLEKMLPQMKKILAGDLISLQKQHRKLSEEIERIEGHLASSNALAEITSLEKKLGEARETSRKLEERRRTLDERVSSMKEEIPRLRSELEESIAEIEGTQVELTGNEWQSVE